MAVQLESALRCATCRGEKEVSVGCAHHGEACACDVRKVRCHECEGSGRTSCLVCGDDATVVRDGEVYCAGCDPDEERSYYDDRSGPTLREQYEQAAAMKRWDDHPAW